MDGITKLVIVGKGEPETGGIATYMRMLEQSLDRSKVDPVFLNLAPAESGRVGRWSLENAVRTLRDMSRVLRAGRNADVVHLHSALAPSSTAVRAGFLGLAARAGGSLVILHVHGGKVPGWVDGRVSRGLTRWVLAPANLIVAVSRGGYEALLPVAGDRIRFVRNGVEVDRFAGTPIQRDSVPTVGFVGALVEEKGVRELLEASIRISESGIEHRLVLVGGGSLDWLGPTHLADVHSRHHIQLVGKIDHAEIAGWYHQFDVLCLASWSEAAPLVVLEAMASGVAVVATDVGDVKSFVTHDVTGLVVPPRSVDSLAAALERLLCDAELRRAMGGSGRAVATAEMGWNATVRQLEALILESA